ncbi:MAG TPA: hypothetical protein VFZ31_05905 [Vicinamibacterales bacterium]
MEIGIPSASHFIFIPAVLLIGVVIGWVLGSRAAVDAYAAQARRAEGKRQKAEGRTD